MASKKTTMFKTVSNMHVEVLPDRTWNSFLRIDKMQDSFNSAYVDKVRISYIYDSEESETQAGLMFVASLDNTLSATPATNDGQMIASSAHNGAGGVVTLPIKRSVRSNEIVNDSSRSGDPIYLHLRGVAIGESSNILLCVETFGRLQKATSL